ncbi:MAG TPA: SseB family protein [Pirellulaceae bacterium]|nr:SseB family protein [Pirellulaceae bacterium]
MAPILSSLLAILGIAGCQPSARDEPASIKELIESYQDAPLGESIHEVSRGLAQCYVVLPTEGIHEEGKTLRIKTARDNQGREWAYAYTDESELLAAFPKGSPYVQLRFGDAFAIVAGDPRFGGIFINHTDQYKYLIPIEVFKDVQAELDAAPELPPLEPN